MEKKLKLNYDPPRVITTSFVVEEGLHMSVRTTGFDMPLFDDATWDDPSTSSSTNHFGSGGWDGGSSFSNNHSFGADSWDQ